MDGIELEAHIETRLAQVELRATVAGRQHLQDALARAVPQLITTIRVCGQSQIAYRDAGALDGFARDRVRNAAAELGLQQDAQDILTVVRRLDRQVAIGAQVELLARPHGRHVQVALSQHVGRCASVQRGRDGLTRVGIHSLEVDADRIEARRPLLERARHAQGLHVVPGRVDADHLGRLDAVQRIRPVGRGDRACPTGPHPRADDGLARGAVENGAADDKSAKREVVPGHAGDQQHGKRQRSDRGQPRQVWQRWQTWRARQAWQGRSALQGRQAWRAWQSRQARPAGQLW